MMPFLDAWAAVPLLDAVASGGPDTVSIAALGVASVAIGGAYTVVRMWSEDRRREDATRREALKEWQDFTRTLERVGRAVERLTDMYQADRDRRVG